MRIRNEKEGNEREGRGGGKREREMKIENREDLTN